MQNCSIWNEVWQTQNLDSWDYLSQVIFDELEVLVEDFRSKKIVELGSGSGRISKKLAEHGAHTTLLDFSEEALFLSKKLFNKENIKADFILGELPKTPLKQRTFDVVWNSGVLEHSKDKELFLSIEEMKRLCKTTGLVITFNPYAGSWLHNIGKNFIIKRAEYPFGEEYPISSLEEMIKKMGCLLYKKEYSIGFFVLFVGMFKRLSLLPRGKKFYSSIFRLLNKVFCAFNNSFLGLMLRRLDKIFSRILGGYLLVSVFSPAKK